VLWSGLWLLSLRLRWLSRSGYVCGYVSRGWCGDCGWCGGWCGLRSSRSWCIRVVVVGIAFAGSTAGMGPVGSASAKDFAYRLENQIAPGGGSFGSLGASSVAVSDFNGDRYVADSGSGTIDVFSSKDVQLAGLNGALTPSGSFGGGAVSVAADNATGLVYVLDSTDNVVDEFGSKGEFVCEITGTVNTSHECDKTGSSTLGALNGSEGFEGPGGIGVDQATGDVYVADAHHGAVDVFGSTGEYLEARSIALSVLPEGFNENHLNGVAADDFNGDVFASDAGTFGVFEFGGAGEYVTTWHGSAETNAPGIPQGGFERFLDVAADNAGGSVYVSEAEERAVDVFSSAGGFLTQLVGPFGVAKVVFGEPRGVAVDQASGGVFVSDDGSPVVVDEFAALLLAGVVAEAPSEVTPTGVTLNGLVEPEGLKVDSCEFEWGTSTKYGHTAECLPSAKELPADTGKHAVTAKLTGLVADTTYHYRLVVGNGNGVNAGQPAQDIQFTTPGPGIESESTTEVTGDSVSLEGSVDPNDAATSVYFQYTTGSVEACTPASCSSAPALPGKAMTAVNKR